MKFVHCDTRVISNEIVNLISNELFFDLIHGSEITKNDLANFEQSRRTEDIF